MEKSGNVCRLVQCLYMCGLDLPDYPGNEEDHEQKKDCSNGEKAEAYRLEQWLYLC